MYGRFIKSKNSKDMKPIWTWLLSNRGKWAFAPTKKLKKEWKDFPNKRGVEELQRKGAIKIIPSDNVEKKERELKGKIKSNDEHYIALAMVSEAKLLLSGDKKLGDDFENPDFVGGKVYNRYTLARAKKLLTPDTCP